MEAAGWRECIRPSSSHRLVFVVASGLINKPHGGTSPEGFLLKENIDGVEHVNVSGLLK